MKKVDISYVDIKKFIEANYIKDIHIKAKDGVSTEKHGEETYYFNKSPTFGAFSETFSKFK